MDPLRLLGRFFRKEKLPLTHEDMAERASSLDEYFRRLQGKRILVFDPPFWGFHDLFVDREGRVILICLKAEGGSFAFTGDERGASLMQKYGPGPVLNAEEPLEPGILEWVLYDDFIVYRGPFFPISRYPYYLGKVAASFPYDGTSDKETIPVKISVLLEWYKASKNKKRP